MVLCPYTMKTIPLIKTDRSEKKRCGFFRVGKHNRCLNLASRHGPILLEQTALFLTRRSKSFFELFWFGIFPLVASRLDSRRCKLPVWIYDSSSQRHSCPERLCHSKGFIPLNEVVTSGLPWLGSKTEEGWVCTKLNEYIGDFESTEEAFCCPDFRVTTWVLYIDPPFAKLIRGSWFS